MTEEFKTINEFDEYKRSLTNKLISLTREKQKIMNEIKEADNQLVMANNTVKINLKAQIKDHRFDVKNLNEKIRFMKNDIKHIDFIIKLLSYEGDDEKILNVRDAI